VLWIQGASFGTLFLKSGYFALFCFYKSVSILQNVFT
jgi:hypothetical protein